MNVSVRTHAAGYPIYSVSVEDSQFELSAFGGQLLSWSKAGTPILFSNHEKAIQDGKTAYRGGAPICFPYFGKGPLLPGKPTLSPQHGHARTSVWDVETLSDKLIFRTVQPSPDGFGPSSISCELTYTFGDGVEIGVKIANVGDNPSPVQFAVHSYWACTEPTLVKIEGLNTHYLDNLNGLTDGQDPNSSAPHQAPIDRVYLQALDTLELLTDRFRLLAETQNCHGAVLWNPGPNHGLADLGSPDFICLESGVFTPPVDLAPGEQYNLTIHYRVELFG